MLELILSFGAAVVVSTVCSLFEAVLYSVPMSHIESLVHQGRRAGFVLRELRRDVDKPISAILTLNTIAHTGGAAIAGAAFVKLFGEGAVPQGIFAGVFTLTILFVSEVIPKTVGVVYTRQLAEWIALPLKWMTWAFEPVLYILGLVTRVIAKGKAVQPVSQDDLMIMARMSHRTGTIDDDEVRVIQNILTLDAKCAKDVMTPRPVVFRLDSTLSAREAYPEVSDQPYSRLPVYSEDDEDIVGIALRSDILAAMAEGRTGEKLQEMMTPVHFVVESLSLNRLLTMFLARKTHMFIVVDEHGGLSGVVTLEDVLEEILGREILDESDEVADLQELARLRLRRTLDESQPEGGAGS